MHLILGVWVPGLSKVWRFLSSETHLALGCWIRDRGPVLIFRVTPALSQALKRMSSELILTCKQTKNPLKVNRNDEH